MSAESDKFTADVDRLETEKDQIIALVTQSQTDLVAANQKIADLIASNATDAELAAAARAAQPRVEKVITDMDALTPEGTPTLRAAGKRK